ncbi:hypothetical protein VTJ04DRAFT_10245 [Mycothermus thermophilus]|uniref:uncharacterized protein n=1 Tax=Humicola insolens TaxID=85995 RepID=UPI003741F2C6
MMADKNAAIDRSKVTKIEAAPRRVIPLRSVGKDDEPKKPTEKPRPLTIDERMAFNEVLEAIAKSVNYQDREEDRLGFRPEWWWLEARRAQKKLRKSLAKKH